MVFQILAVVAAVALVIATWQIWLLFFTALIIAAAILPAARWGEQRRIPRGVTVLVVYVGVIALLTLLASLVATLLAVLLLVAALLLALVAAAAGRSTGRRSIDGGLVADEPGVGAVAGEQLVVRAALDDAAGVEDEDPVGLADRAESMSDDEAGPRAHEDLEGPLDDLVAFLGEILEVEMAMRVDQHSGRYSFGGS